MLLVGKCPFYGNSDQEIFEMAKKGRPDYSTGAWSYISREGVQFVHELLTLDPELRPSAAMALNHPWLNHMESPKVDQGHTT